MFVLCVLWCEKRVVSYPSGSDIRRVVVSVALGLSTEGFQREDVRKDMETSRD